MICFFESKSILLKRLNVLGVGCSKEIKVVVDILCVNLYKVLIIEYVVELFNFVEILFMNNVFNGFIIIFFVVICFF